MLDRDSRLARVPSGRRALDLYGRTGKRTNCLCDAWDTANERGEHPGKGLRYRSPPSLSNAGKARDAGIRTSRLSEFRKSIRSASRNISNFWGKTAMLRVADQPKLALAGRMGIDYANHNSGTAG
jgi:hypothetical protein